MTVLVRRHISKRLADYYAQPSNLVVGANPSSGVNFKNLLGEWHWRRTYKRLYEEQQGQWLTPVELFSPYYSQVLAEYCIQQQQHNQNESEEFEIVELGGGRGTNARGIVNHLRDKHPDFYERLVSYTIVDASPTLHQLQQEVLDGEDKLKFLLKDLTDVAERKTSLLPSERSTTSTVFLGLELLDNLAHDKIRRDAISRVLEHAVIHQDDDGREVFQPFSDPLLKRILLTFPSYGGTKGQPLWLPSVACGVLMEIAQQRPNCDVLMADFDFLPLPDLVPVNDDNDDNKKEEDDDVTMMKERKSIPAEGEPLVTDMNGIDHECYLNAPHLSDILYPTDFAKLSRFCKKIFPNADVVKQGSFLQKYGPQQVQATKSRWTGFSPMIHDFYNCSILTASQRAHNGKLK